MDGLTDHWLTFNLHRPSHVWITTHNINGFKKQQWRTGQRFNGTINENCPLISVKLQSTFLAALVWVKWWLCGAWHLLIKQKWIIGVIGRNPEAEADCTHSYHLSDTEAVLEVVEGDVIVASVHFIKKLLQHVQLNVEGGDEVQICVHDLEQHHNLSILPLPAIAQHFYLRLI